MKYGKQQYTEGQAALAYASNHVDGQKFRLSNLGKDVEALRGGKWVVVGSAKVFAEKWDALNPYIF